MSDAPTADPGVEPDGNRDEQTNGDPDQGGDSGESDRRDVDRTDVEQSARDADLLEGHSRPSDDAAGVNPSRSQQARRPGAG